MEELTNTSIMQAIHARGIEIMVDPRSIEDIAQQIGILPVLMTESAISRGTTAGT